MGGMAFDEFDRLLKSKIKDKSTAQIVWAVAQKVDWSAKRMTAMGVVDNLEYYNVILGINHITVKPKVGSRCLLGVIGNKGAATFLIEAENVEEMVVVQDEAKLTIKESGFIIEKGNESLTDVLTDFMDEVLKIIVINGTSVNVPALTAIKNRLKTILK